MTSKPLGPGPGAYLLPPLTGHPRHDPSRDRAPAYSLQARADARFGSLGPGPAYRVQRVTRDGAEFAPAWSFGLRVETRATSRAPGPGAHCPERAPAGPRAPAYSLGARLDRVLQKTSPAPNAYALLSREHGPAFSMGARCEGGQRQPLSPGPARYGTQDLDVYRTRAAHYSLGARCEGGQKQPLSPGPAAYCLRNLYPSKAYSFGTHHGLYAPPLIVPEDTMDCL